MAKAQAKSNADKSRIKRQGVLSKGERNSGGRVHRKAAAIIAVADRVATNMREAFINMTIPADAKGDAITKHVLQGIKHNTGNNKVGRGWSANLSPRTIRTLTEQGIFA